MAEKGAATTAKRTRSTTGGAARTRRAPASGKGATTRRKKRPQSSGPSLDTVLDVVGITVTLLGFLTLLAMLPSGQLSAMQPYLDWLVRLFGVGAFAAPVALMAGGFWLVARRFLEGPPPPWYRLLGLALFGLAALGFVAYFGNTPEATPGGSGGLLGYYTARGLELAVGRIGAPVALFFLGLMGLLLVLELSLADVARTVASLKPEPKARPATAPAEPRVKLEIPNPLPSLFEAAEHGREWLYDLFHWRDGEAEAGPPVTAPAMASKQLPAHTAQAEPPEAAPTIETPWQLPPWQTLLEEAAEGDLNANDIRNKVRVIEDTLEQFGVPARVVEVRQGPTVTQYGLEPGFVRRKLRNGEERETKVKVSAITNLHNDLALALSAQRIRIEAPVPGRPIVGIEVPNDQAAPVTLRGVMESDEFQAIRAPLKVALGKDVSGNAVVADLSKMPHLLIAGSTGSGKSVCINTIICGLLCNNTPDQLKLLMVDPKMVELVGYNGIPHLIVPVVTDMERVVGLLRWTVTEMERRYKIFSEQHVRHLQAFNARAISRGEKPLPYLVLIIDELADLMMAAADEVEGMICRLAQMARATGIHLILATQRPSVDVVTGLIKANFPARIAFAVTSGIDSRVILDRPGAEMLLGRGDMLYTASDSGFPKRAQGCFVSDKELERINLFWMEQAATLAQPAVAIGTEGQSIAPEPSVAVAWDDLLDDGEDDLLPKAREIVRKAGSASVSMLQRRLRVGYSRAAQLVELLEEEGTIGASESPTRTRNVMREEAIPGSDDDPGYDPKWVNED